MSGSPMAGEIAAAQSLVNILYGGNGTTGGTNTITGLYVGVVPFTTTVNIKMAGFTPTTWLTTVGQAQIANKNLYPTAANAPVTSTSVGGQWMGCIEARTPNSYTSYGYTNYASGMDSTDTPPTSNATKFTPFLYPSTIAHIYTYDQPLNRGTTSTATVAKGAPSWNGTVRGDNDWNLNGTVPATAIYITPASVYFGDNYQLNSGNPDGNYGVGPNLGCPIPILPLTASQTTVQATLANMKSTFRGGTMINAGLAAGWWLISPNWTSTWTAAGLTPTTPLPVPQPYANTLKVIVLMTDGTNQWFDWPIGEPGLPATTSPIQNDADYTGYGRLGEGRVGSTNPATIATTLNNSMLNMCTTLQAQGVQIYTVLFNHDGTAGNSAALLQSCASVIPGQTTYFQAVTNADLLAAFQSIGTSISDLRLTWPGKP